MSTGVQYGSGIALLTIIAWWRIFKKAGLRGWYALIPIYNFYIYCQITLGNGWYLLGFLIPFLNIILLIYSLYKLSYSFGHGFLFMLGLWFLYPIFILVLAFDGSKYVQGRE